MTQYPLPSLILKDQGLSPFNGSEKKREEKADGDRGLLLRADYAYRCRQIDSLRCAQLHGDKYFTLVRAAYT